MGEQQRLLRNLLSVPRVVDTALRTRVGTSPRTVVLEEGTHTLLHYRRETPATQAEPVLLCYALVNRPYILDLQPDKSVVRQYLDRGFEVYMIDWGAPSHADRGLTLEHYVSGFLARAVDFVRRKHDRPKLHLLGYCMGGTMAAMHGALQPDTLATLTLLAAPIDFSGSESLLNLWTDHRTFDVDAFIDALRQLPGLVSAVVLPVHEPDPELRRQGDRVLGADGRPEQRRQPLRARTLAQRQHPGGRRNIPGVRQQAVSAQRAGARASSASAAGPSTCAASPVRCCC